MQFTTEVNDVDLYGCGEPDDNTACSSVTVRWSADIDAKDWGIKAISVSVISVTGSYMIQRWNAGKDNYDDEEEIVIDSKGWELEAESAAQQISEDIIPYNVEINFKDKTITVNF